MAEFIAVVGVLSSILQVVDCSARVVSHSYELAKTGKESTRDNLAIQRLAAQYRALGQSIAEKAEEERTKRSGVIDAFSYYEAEVGRPQDQWEQQQKDAVIQLATECKDEGEELVRLLSSLKIDPKLSGSKRFKESIRQGARGVGKQSEIEKRRKRLSEKNGLLATRLLQQIKERYGERDRLSYIRPPYAPTKSGKTNICLAVQLASQQKIHPLLTSLHFAEMHSRRRNICSTHPQTFVWALESESSGLRHWLRAQSGIFWVTGKAGSGKSTLMKLVAESSATRMLLHQWTGPDNRPANVAAFYFWYLGTDEEKSITGLLRSILYQVFIANPQLAEIAFPEFVKNGEMCQDVSEFSWDHARLVEALHSLATARGSHSGTKICLIIDGLDEYIGNHLELVILLQGLVTNNQNIKLCLSSRPWNAFRNAFETNVPHFRMEDLTMDDICHYVDDRIRAFKNLASVQEHDLEALVHLIARKAEGVFLWVVLVVNSVLEGFAEGETTRFLRARVEAFPGDLKDFFELMIQRVHEVYRQRTHQSLKLAWMIEHRDGMDGWSKAVTNLTDFWVISQEVEGLRDPAFVHRHGRSTLDHEKWLQMARETTQFLSASTKDLLVVDVDEWRVRFLHRTVYDFLNSADIQALLDSWVPDHLKDGSVLHLLNLTRLRLAMPMPMLQQPSNFELAEQDLILVSVSMSLSQQHRHIDAAYVCGFDGALTMHHNALSGNAKMALKNRGLHQKVGLPVMVAFGCTEFIMECWALGETSMELYWPLIEAALGKCPLRRFSLRKADCDVLATLLACGDLVDIAFDEVWQFFLRRWTKSKDARCKSCESESLQCPRRLQSRHIWELAKTILGHLPHIDDCHNFLKRHVPEAWLLETKATRRLVSVAGTEEDDATSDADGWSSEAEASFGEDDIVESCEQ